MVIATIWFFFWAKDGGFVWGENDWEDYKSSVKSQVSNSVRSSRKDKDGKTLSNATKSTRLGGKSVRGGGSVWKRGKAGKGEYEKGTWDEEDALTDAGDFEAAYRDEKASKKARKQKQGRDGRVRQEDADVLAYRAEQPARVGGLNRAHDGSHYDYSNNSDTQPLKPKPTSKKEAPAPAPKRKTFMEKQREAKTAKRAAKQAKEDIARARKEREEFASRPRAGAGVGVKPAVSLRRRNSVSTVATSTVFSSEASRSELSVAEKKEKNSYYTAYRPATRERERERGHERDSSRTRRRSASRDSRSRAHGGGGEVKDGHGRTRSRSHSRQRGGGGGEHSRQASPRKERSRFPPSSYNGSEVSAGSGEGGVRTAAGARVVHPQVPELRGGGGIGGGYAGRRPGGYANRFKDELSDSEEEDDDGDLGGMRGLGGRKW